MLHSVWPALLVHTTVMKALQKQYNTVWVAGNFQGDTFVLILRSRPVISTKFTFKKLPPK